MNAALSNKGAVVITGTSTGIGRACALRLAKEGYRVYAGVRKEADGEALQREAKGTLVPLLLDVTDEEQVAAAAELVAGETGSRGIVALVNNAGTAVTGPSEFMPVEVFRRSFEINFFGHVRVTQAFLPLIRRGGGRLINIGSVGDRLVMPFGGAFNGPKHALKVFNDALRLELRPWGIHVVLLEPASIKTAAVDKLEPDADAMLERLGEPAEQLYGEIFRSMISNFAKHPRKYGQSPDQVAECVFRALTAERPRTRYLVGYSARPLSLIARFAPDRVFDRIRIKVFHQPREFGFRRDEKVDTLASGGRRQHAA